jgi:hypothetical protein
MHPFRPTGLRDGAFPGAAGCQPAKPFQSMYAANT